MVGGPLRGKSDQNYLFSGTVFVATSLGAMTPQITFGVIFPPLPIAQCQDVIYCLALRTTRIVIMVRSSETIKVKVFILLNFAFKADNVHLVPTKIVVFFLRILMTLPVIGLQYSEPQNVHFPCPTGLPFSKAHSITT